MTDAAADFWRFSLAVYAAPGVADECLALQDDHGLDVNIALYCCWVGWSGRGALTAAAVAAAEARVAAWTREVVVPLRGVRRALKPAPAPAAAAIRSTVKRLELDAEREEQQLLVADTALSDESAAKDTAAAAGNLSVYLKAHGATGAEISKLLSALSELTPHTSED